MTPKAQALCRGINQYQASCASRRIYAWPEAGREMSSIRMCGDKVEMECLSIECLFWMGTARRDRRSQYCSVHMQVWSVNSWSFSGCCVQARNRRVKEKARKLRQGKSPSGLLSIFDLKTLLPVLQLQCVLARNHHWAFSMIAAKESTVQRAVHCRGMSTRRRLSVKECDWIGEWSENFQQRWWLHYYLTLHGNTPTLPWYGAASV